MLWFIIMKKTCAAQCVPRWAKEKWRGRWDWLAVSLSPCKPPLSPGWIFFPWKIRVRFMAPGKHISQCGIKTGGVIVLSVVIPSSQQNTCSKCINSTPWEEKKRTMKEAVEQVELPLLHLLLLLWWIANRESRQERCPSIHYPVSGLFWVLHFRILPRRNTVWAFKQ